MPWQSGLGLVNRRIRAISPNRAKSKMTISKAVANILCIFGNLSRFSIARYTFENRPNKRKKKSGRVYRLNEKVTCRRLSGTAVFFAGEFFGECGFLDWIKPNFLFQQNKRRFIGQPWADGGSSLCRVKVTDLPAEPIRRPMVDNSQIVILSSSDCRVKSRCKVLRPRCSSCAAS